MQNIITICIHNRFIYFKIITCIILGLVISNVFTCKANSVFSDFVDSCVTGKGNPRGNRTTTRGHTFCKTGELNLSGLPRNRKSHFHDGTLHNFPTVTIQLSFLA